MWTCKIFYNVPMWFMHMYMTRNARWWSRRSRYIAAAHAPDFDTLVPVPELSLVDAKNNPFRKMRDTLYRERQLWSGNEDGEIRYVSGSSVAGTSALSPGVPRHIAWEPPLFLSFPDFGWETCYFQIYIPTVSFIFNCSGNWERYNVVGE